MPDQMSLQYQNANQSENLQFQNAEGDHHKPEYRDLALNELIIQTFRRLLLILLVVHIVSYILFVTNFNGRMIC